MTDLHADEWIQRFLDDARKRLVELQEEVAAPVPGLPAERFDQMGRELHRIKGGANMVGLEEMAQLADALKRRLPQSSDDGGLDDLSRGLLREGLQQLLRAIDTRRAGDSLPTSDLRSMIARLRDPS